MPVVLLTTEHDDGTANLAPISSAWVLGQNVVLGLGDASQTARNLAVRTELALNVAVLDLWEQVERRAPLTGVDPVPENRRAVYRHEPDKFAPLASPPPTPIS
ncbi:hypothetical protein ABZ078_26695 [Streptomyces sp. NPDC006385]|uniref:hypothetical protein n=1 Tax=Streptomyces sp. NPDC006385 TaxID=3156761 RepID=UPI0033B747BD